ncbi:MAG: hypothetical protein EON58_18255 [Alphaproteobacteria bacterium]|nr:MAG: hypothetical protein EON58_18255 [Alphaproteobacteria bacterium]
MNGQPGVIKDYAYESVAGGSIVASATGVTVPEAGTLALILPGMAGIAGLVTRHTRHNRYSVYNEHFYRQAQNTQSQTMQREIDR